MSPHRKRSSPNRLNWLIVLILAVVIIGVFFVLSSFGPRSAGTGPDNRVTDEAALALLEQSRTLEEKFEELLIEGVVDSEDMEVLLRSIDLQKEYIAALPARDFVAENRLERLEMRFSEYKGEILAREAQLLESQARAAGNDREKLMLLREAAGIREDIRDQHGTSSRNEITLLARLQREIQTLEVQPIYDRSLALEAEGDELASKGDLERAVSRYGAAAELQEQINRTHSDLALAKPLRASRLREKEAAVLSGELRRQIDGLIREANDFVYEEEYEKAATAFSRAREMQRNLNLEFPRSPYASQTREERLRVRMQNASAFDSYERLRDLETLLNRSLREGNFQEARILIGQLSDRLSQFQVRYSLSTLPIDALADRISYLRRKERDLGEIQSSINSDLLPLPGEAAAGLLVSEVPQYLFELVTDSNPSRHVGMELPVETISPAEVEQFLQQVSWVLAREVRLPTLSEFRRAAAEVLAVEDFEVFCSGSGVSETRSVQSLAPGPSGFYHLLGNVSEMVTSGESPGVFHVGGNLRTIREQILEMQPVRIDSGERNRMVGFRFVVLDIPLPPSLTEDPEV